MKDKFYTANATATTVDIIPRVRRKESPTDLEHENTPLLFEFGAHDFCLNVHDTERAFSHSEFLCM